MAMASAELVRPLPRKPAPLDAEQRRRICRQGHAVVHQALGAERRRTGTEGLQSFAEGAARQIALELSLRVSPEFARQIFTPAFVQDVLDEVADQHAQTMTEEAP